MEPITAFTPSRQLEELTAQFKNHLKEKDISSEKAFIYFNIHSKVFKDGLPKQDVKIVSTALRTNKQLPADEQFQAALSKLSTDNKIKVLNNVSTFLAQRAAQDEEDTSTMTLKVTIPLENKSLAELVASIKEPQQNNRPKPIVKSEHYQLNQLFHDLRNDKYELTEIFQTALSRVVLNAIAPYACSLEGKIEAGLISLLSHPIITGITHEPFIISCHFNLSSEAQNRLKTDKQGINVDLYINQRDLPAPVTFSQSLCDAMPTHYLPAKQKNEIQFQIDLNCSLTITDASPEAGGDDNLTLTDLAIKDHFHSMGSYEKKKATQLFGMYDDKFGSFKAGVPSETLSDVQQTLTSLFKGSAGNTLIKEVDSAPSTELWKDEINQRIATSKEEGVQIPTEEQINKAFEVITTLDLTTQEDIDNTKELLTDLFNDYYGQRLYPTEHQEQLQDILSELNARTITSTILDGIKHAIITAGGLETQTETQNEDTETLDISTNDTDTHSDADAPDDMDET